MKSMTNRLLLAAGLIFAISVVASAQQSTQTCNTYLTMYIYDQRVGLIPAPGMTSDQSDWFKKKGNKKYPDFCFSTEKASYIMVTVRWAENKEQTVTRTESARTTGPITTVGGRSSNGDPVWQTQLGTFVTTWNTHVNEIVSEPRAYVLVFETKDGNPISSTTELRSDPVIQAMGIGKNAGRDALEFVLKNWDMKLKSASQ